MKLLNFNEKILYKNGLIQGLDGAELKNIVDQICDSAALKASPRLCALLRYLIEQERNGRRAKIKAYSIALDVFGRDEHFDPINNSLVRVEMSRLRKALSQYNNESIKSYPYTIEIHNNSYIPILSKRIKIYNKKRKILYSYVALAILLLFWIFFAKDDMPIKNQKCIRDRPVVKIIVKSNNDHLKIYSNEIYKYFRENINSYSMVKLQSKDCNNNSLILKVNIEKNPDGEFYFESILENSANNEIDTYSDKLNYTEARDVKKFVSGKIMYKFFGENFFYLNSMKNLKLHVNNNKILNELLCLKNYYGYFKYGAPNLFVEAAKCLESLVPRESLHADVHAMYASLAMYQMRGVSPRYFTDPKRVFETAMMRAAEIDGNDAIYLLERLAELRNDDKENPGVLRHVIDEIQKGHPANAYLTGHAGRALGIYFGEWQAGAQMVQDARAMMGEPESFPVFELASAIASGDTQAANLVARRLRTSKIPVTELEIAVVGAMSGDDDMRDRALQSLKAMGVRCVDDARRVLQKAHFDRSLNIPLEKQLPALFQPCSSD